MASFHIHSLMSGYFSQFCVCEIHWCCHMQFIFLVLSSLCNEHITLESFDCSRKFGLFQFEAVINFAAIHILLHVFLFLFKIFIFTLFYFTILYWFCHTLTWIFFCEHTSFSWCVESINGWTCYFIDWHLFSFGRYYCMVIQSCSTNLYLYSHQKGPRAVVPLQTRQHLVS